jgi:hypothetical protein
MLSCLGVAKAEVGMAVREVAATVMAKLMRVNVFIYFVPYWV